jgi:acyl-coenzyme A synthetase/AMP-(fatty) acid ligase
MTLADVIELEDERHFLLRGRNEDMLNIAGKRASLADLNLKLQQVPGVVDGVIFAPETHGEAGRLAALVVAPGMTRDQVLAALRRSVDPVFLPRPLYLVDALPRAESSKLPRAALLDLLRREAARA